MAAEISIIIPAYNEMQAIESTVSELWDYMKDRQDIEIIVINDGSTDDTGEILDKLKLKCEKLKTVHHRRNKGYGTAIKSGINVASGKYVAWYDADGQHRPEDLEKLITNITQQDWDYCIGIRSEDSYKDPDRRVGKFILKKIVDFFAREKTVDFNSGMRIFKRDILAQYFTLLPQRFGASTVTTLLMQELDYVGGGTKISVRKRIGKSSVKQFRDGFRTISLIFQIIILFRPMQVFGNIGLLAVLTGGIYGLVKAALEGQGFPVLGAVILIFGILTMFLGIISSQISQLRLQLLSNGKV